MSGKISSKSNRSNRSIRSNVDLKCSADSKKRKKTTSQEKAKKNEKISKKADSLKFTGIGVVTPKPEFNISKKAGTGNANKYGQKNNKSSKKKVRALVRKVIVTITTIFGVLLLAYTGVSVYFLNHFLFNTTINGQDFSRATVDYVVDSIKEQVENYQLTIIEATGNTEVIHGSDFSLSFRDEGVIQEVLDNQIAFLWPLALFGLQEVEKTVTVMFDEGELSQRIHRLRAVTSEQELPVSAQPVYKDGYFVIEPEQWGTLLDVDNLSRLIREGISVFSREINLIDAGIYLPPRFTSDSPEVIAARDALNRFISASITYNMDTQIVVDREVISDWVSACEDMVPVIHEDRVTKWIDEFANKYDTRGTTRAIVTPAGRVAEVSGGYYGWRINREGELDTLVANIRNGDVISREPIFSSRAAVHGPQDWGSTFIQVDLSAQYMWYFVDGLVVFQSPIVTGRPPYMVTPAGIFIIQEMLRDTILSGAVNPETGEVADDTPVAYWMRITWDYPVPGIGFHDATWQASFGGDRFLTHGSHGCINMPLDRARELFEMISEHLPVIVHK